MKKQICAILSAFVLLFSIYSNISFAQKYTTSKSSETAKVTDANFKLATDYSKQMRGLSVLVMKGDKIIFEEYQNGHTAETAHMLASGTKSFSGVMAVAAQQDGLLKLDEKVCDTITEWKSDPLKSKITIRQLLSLTSGLDAGAIGLPPNNSEAINFRAKHEPATKFEYGPVPFQVFGELMRRKLQPQKENVMDYLKRRILNPIGLNVKFWRTDSNGNPLLPQGAVLTAREWAKFGLFLKNGGKWDGKQIIPEKLLKECFVGTKANPSYGLTFWLNANGARNGRRQQQGSIFGNRQGDVTEISENGIQPEGPKDLFMAAGAGKQRLYVIPSLDLVIVRQGQQSRFDDKEFLARLLFGKEI